MEKFIEGYGQCDYEIWHNGFNYDIRNADYSKKSRGYDELWYAKRAIDKNNIEWLMTPEQFKEIRLNAGFSQARLAKLLNLSHGTISNYENGHKVIEESVANKMENYK